MNRRKIYWSRIDLKDIVIKFAKLLIVMALMIPTSLAFFETSKVVQVVILVLLALLAVYTLYTSVMVFYYLDEEDLKVFYLFKTYNFKVKDINKMEKIDCKSNRNVTLGLSVYKLKVRAGKQEFFISPQRRLEFLDNFIAYKKELRK